VGSAGRGGSEGAEGAANTCHQGTGQGWRRGRQDSRSKQHRCLLPSKQAHSPIPHGLVAWPHPATPCCPAACPRRRREAEASGLSPEVAEQVEVMRLGLMLHLYNTTTLLTHPQGPEGPEVALPPVAPLMVSAAKPPPTAPTGPPAPGRGLGGLPVLAAVRTGVTPGSSWAASST
jgi:hypothetical protein